MSPFQRRLFIFFDEWLGVLLLLYLWKTEDKLFQPILIVWLIMVYGISYPFHWVYQYKERKLFNEVQSKVTRNIRL